MSHLDLTPDDSVPTQLPSESMTAELRQTMRHGLTNQPKPWTSQFLKTLLSQPQSVSQPTSVIKANRLITD